MTSDLDVLTVGRVGVDLYAEEPNASFIEARRFQKSVGGSPTNVAVAAARLGRRAAVFTKVGDDDICTVRSEVDGVIASSNANHKSEPAGTPCFHISSAMVAAA